MNKVYLISCGEGQFKIGVTRRDVSKRIKELKTGNSNPFHVISVFESKRARKIENTLHGRFKHKLLDGEWFNLDQEEVNNFTRYCISIHENLEYITKTNTWVEEKGGYK